MPSVPIREKHPTCPRCGGNRNYPLSGALQGPQWQCQGCGCLFSTYLGWREKKCPTPAQTRNEK